MSFTNGLDNPELYFQVKIYTGTGGSQSLTFDGSEDMQPDWIWVKDRGRSGYNHVLNDSVRGVTKYIRSNLTNAEATISDAITSFDSDGFTLGSDSSNGEHNVSSQTYVAWCWKESPTAGFDIVSYTGNNTVRTISHNLSAVPKWMIFKERDGTGNWIIYHGANTSAPETDLLILNSNGATIDDASAWNDTAPTSSVFTLGDGDGGGDNNQNGLSMISYIFAEKQGYSKFGSYIGNGNDDGPFIYTGFRPAWVMIKGSTNTGSWRINDNKREPFNVMDTLLFPETNDADTTNSGYSIDFLSNGFKIRGTNASANASGISYIYMAFAESPFVNSKGIPTNAR